MSGDDQELPEALRGLEGLPQHIIDEITLSANLTFFRILGNWLFMIVMTGGFAFGAFWLWQPLEGLAQRNAEAFAQTVQGFSAETNFGIGLLIGMFVWIVFSSAIVAIIIRIIPMPAKAAMYFAGRKEIEQTSPKFMRQWSNENSLEIPHSASDAINQRLDPYIRKTLFITMPFVFLAALICVRETQSHQVFSASGLYQSGILSNSFEHRLWTSAKSVALGCNQTDEGGSLIYDVEFQDGKSVRLPDASSLNGRSWLENIGTIDETLRSTDAEFTRWTWMKRDPLHPTCLRSFYTELGAENKPRLDRLLRIGEFEGAAEFNR